VSSKKVEKREQKGRFWAIFGCFWAFFAVFEFMIFTCGQKPTFFSYLIVIKKFKKYIKWERKVAN